MNSNVSRAVQGSGGEGKSLPARDGLFKRPSALPVVRRARPSSEVGMCSTSSMRPSLRGVLSFDARGAVETASRSYLKPVRVASQREPLNEMAVSA